MISRKSFRLLPIFFDSSKAFYAKASKLAFQAQTVEAFDALIRQELLPKNIEYRSSHSCLCLI